MANFQGQLVGHSAEYILRCGSQSFNCGIGPSIDRCAGCSCVCWMVGACMKNLLDLNPYYCWDLGLLYSIHTHYDTSPS